MKWALAVAMFTATGLAIPVFPGPSPNSFKLQLKARYKALDGQYLSVNGTDVGVFKSLSKAPLEVYPLTNGTTGLVELHTLPQGKINGTLALVGRNDFFTFSNIPDPANARFPVNTTCDWRSFKLTGGSPSAPERANNTLTYVGAQGRWVAFPKGNQGDWTIQFLGDGAMTTANFMPIDALVYVPARDVNDGGDGEVTIQ